MFLNLRISLFTLIIPVFVFTQSDSTSFKRSFFYDVSSQKSMAFTFSHQILSTTGNNFLGQAYDGDGGYNFSLSLFLYKNLFLRYNGGRSSFDITNTELVGNYTRSRLGERFFSLGYEFVPFNKLKVGVSASVYGTFRLQNNIENAQQRDSGKLRSYGFSINYEVIRNLSIYSVLDFRQLNTDIEAPIPLASFFRRGNYNTINIGVRYAVGNQDALTAMGILK